MSRIHCKSLNGTQPDRKGRHEWKRSGVSTVTLFAFFVTFPPYKVPPLPNLDQRNALEAVPRAAADINRRKQVARAKPKKTAKEQLAQVRANSTSRDTTPKPIAAPRKPSEAQTKPATPPPKTVPEERHVPMNNFNAAEVEAMLSAGASDESEVYKPEKPVPKAGGAWGLGAKRKRLSRYIP
jgi:hypothetical protein